LKVQGLRSMHQRKRVEQVGFEQLSIAVPLHR
jgi:hypothetical protein